MADHQGKDIVLTGPGRSGTSLLSVLLERHCKDVVSFNEAAGDPRPAAVQRWFRRTRQSIIDGKPTPVLLDRTGNVTTNTWRDGAVQSERVLQHPNPVIVCKGVLLYLDHLKGYVERDMRLLLMVRDPVWTVCAWGVPEHRDMNVYGVEDGNLHPFWHKHPFPWRTTDAVGRRCEVWEHDAHIILETLQALGLKGWNGDERVAMVRYEDLAADPAKELFRLAQWLGVEMVGKVEPVKTANRPSRYSKSDVNEVRAKVRRFCPSRHRFGYE